MFYTSVERFANSLLYRGYDENGKQVSKRIKYSPTLYVPIRQGETTPFKALDGTPVKKYQFPDMKQCKEFTSTYPSDLYGNLNHVAAFIQDQFPNNIQYVPDVIRVLNFDIETDSSNGFINPAVADGAIITIAAKCSQVDDRMHVWGTKEYYDEDVVYHKCTSEYHMLESFVAWWKDVNPDVVTGWNCRFYDIPFLLNRVERIIGSDEVKKFSPWGKIRENNITTLGRIQQTFDITGVAVLDYMELTKKFTYQELENYKLNTAAAHFLKDEKLDYSDFGTLAALYDDDYDKFVKYNAQDVELIERFEEELGLIKLVYTMAYMAGVNYNVTLGTTAFWDCMIFRHLARQRTIIPFAKEHTRQPFAGGFVKDVIPCYKKWVVSFDFASLYPKIIVQNNMSPETIVPQSRRTCTPEMLLDEEISSAPDSNLCLAANGSVYRKDKKGIIPDIIDSLYEKRVHLKTQMLKAAQDAEDATDPKEKARFKRCYIIPNKWQLRLP